MPSLTKKDKQLAHNCRQLANLAKLAASVNKLAEANVKRSKVEERDRQLLSDFRKEEAEKKSQAWKRNGRIIYDYIYEWWLHSNQNIKPLGILLFH